MPRRYQSNQRRRRRNPDTYRRRSVLMRPSVQITILIVTALLIYIILQSGGR